MLQFRAQLWEVNKEWISRNLSLRPDPTSQFDAVLGIIDSRRIQTMKNSGNHLHVDRSKSIQINVVDQTTLSQLGNIQNFLTP